MCTSCVTVSKPTHIPREHTAQGRSTLPTLPDRGRSPSASTAATHPGPPGLDPIALEPGHEVGRFTVLAYLGAGATGIVYAAYDPELDRKVALKLLRNGFGGGLGLREAQAMAKLSHPNVAVVHDVGTYEGGVFIAMEFVRGVTLQTWLSEQPRAWPEILDAFVQAGRGLAAAHDAGLVHRDFKPSNAIIGPDGRVRVLDFGLSCRPLDASRELVGTPAYMPPEQFLGLPVGPASDQFSFCASLYEALYGQLPFSGDTTDALRLSITGGHLRTPPRSARVPSWLTAAVLRGLRPDPHDRFPLMEGLLSALERRRGRARLPVAAAALCAALAGTVGYFSAPSHAPDPCTGGADEIAGAWNADRRAAIEQSFLALPPAFLTELWPTVAGELDEYADRWQRVHRGACLAHQRGESSGSLLDRRMACLTQGRAALGEALDVLAHADGEVALHSLELVHALPALDDCADIKALEAEVAPIVHPEIHRRLARVLAFEHAGLVDEAAKQADAVVAEAETRGDPRTLAAALLQRSRLQLHSDQRFTDEDALLTRAFLVALGARADELAVEALALRLYVRGRTPGRLHEALDDLAVAEALLARLPAPARLRGLLLNSAGNVHLAAGDPVHAAPLFREALALRQAALGPRDVEVGNTLTNVAMLEPDPAIREAMLHRALAIFEAELGPAHPHTVEARIVTSAYTRDPHAAIDLLSHGCALLDSFAPDHYVQRAHCLNHLATHALDAGEPALARDALTRARPLVDLDAAHGARLDPTDAALIRSRAGLLGGAHDQAITDAQAALATLPDAPDEWWPRRQRAELELVLGLNLQAIGAASAARDVLARSVDDFAFVADKTRDVLLPRALARARLALAEALIADHQPALAAAPLDAAESWYRAAGDGFAWRLGPIAALRRAAQ
jgi:tetratricopeptide (TPR) repeat protein/predicted Ser/Thr protein kinase